MYILLHRKFANGNTSWKPVRFIKNLKSFPIAVDDLKPRVKFSKFDLFCLIPAEGVSDIPENIMQLWLAKDAKTLIDSTRSPTGMGNWLISYEGMDTEAEVMAPILRKIGAELLLACGIACSEYLIDRPSDPTVILEEAVRRCKEQNGILESYVDLNKISLKKRPALAAHSLYEVALYGSESSLQKLIRNICFEFSSYEGANRELAEVIRSVVPMPVAMLAFNS